MGSFTRIWRPLSKKWARTIMWIFETPSDDRMIASQMFQLKIMSPPVGAAMTYWTVYSRHRCIYQTSCFSILLLQPDVHEIPPACCLLSLNTEVHVFDTTNLAYLALV